ncbi:endonuclease domain-containing protein [Nodosilinea sp. E11]|uniref:endonuclease domain-containing protein n=1 Tax=Nodosilinea sp. E11 TaxID=3037479 RepID=UPI0029345ECE|nr:DUF559 domain-containing protein [Nodosilinea sp. E11]WOD41196.1 DUF559 domain-containing protein [Nodosilinea sp. E11]
MRIPDIETALTELEVISPMQAMFYKEAIEQIPSLEYEQYIGEYRVDFLVKEKKFVIEIDGHDYHKTKEQRTRDCLRQRKLNLYGYYVIRFTGTEVYRNVGSCVRETLDLLKQQPQFANGIAEIHPDHYYCFRIQESVMNLLDRNNCDFYQDECCFRFELGEYFDPLLIIKSGKIASVSHFFTQNCDVINDPQVSFYLEGDDPGYGNWIPVSIQQLFGSRRECSSYDSDADILTTYDLSEQKDIARFCEIWGASIRAQGWITDGQLVS